MVEVDPQTPLIGAGREPLFAGLPDIDLELIATRILDGRLVTLEYRPVASK